MSTFTKLGVPALLAVVGSAVAVAQGLRQESACDDSWPGGNRSAVNVCESRELTLTREDSLEIDGGPNGNVSVTGWDRDEIQVRAQIRSWDRDEDAARDRLDEIEIDTEGKLRAHGPNVRNSWRLFDRNNGGWIVSFEIMAPHDTGLWIESVNGGISVTAMRGSVDVESVNGGISLTDVSATARGRTVNGGISAALTGDTINGEMIDLRTTNGGI